MPNEELDPRIVAFDCAALLGEELGAAPRVLADHLDPVEPTCVVERSRTLPPGALLLTLDAFSKRFAGPVVRRFVRTLRALLSGRQVLVFHEAELPSGGTWHRLTDPRGRICLLVGGLEDNLLTLRAEVAVRDTEDSRAAQSLRDLTEYSLAEAAA